MFEPILGKTMDAYIDYMVVKSKEESNHIKNLNRGVHDTQKTKAKAECCKVCLQSELG